MSHMKPEESDGSIWQGYALQAPSTTTSHIPNFESNFLPAPHSAPSIPYHGRPQIAGLQNKPVLRGDNHALTTSPSTLHSHHSYPSLKRTYDGETGMGYTDNVQEFRDDLAETHKPSMNQDHRLLNFARLPDTHNLVDSSNRIKQISVNAQIHGMFFLSELATPSTENNASQPELTCYRRNLFQICGNVNVPRGQLFVITDRVERVPIISLEVVVSASESVDNHTVKLIVIPWKTPPANSTEVMTGQGQEQEPSPIPLMALNEGGVEPNSTGDFTMFPIAYRRLQFRIATANNGRRRELQQHFLLHLNVVATLADGTKINVCENNTAPIVVRGRSPRNFQARKEVPLVGSSSSRGHPPELHVSTGMSSQSPMIERSTTMPKPGGDGLSRTPFTFDSSTLSGSPSVPRQSSYSQWNGPHTSLSPEHNHNPHSVSQSPLTAYPPTTISMDTYLQSNHMTSPSSNHSLPRSSTLPISRPNLSNYAFNPPTPSTFLSSNPRPAKSPRYTAAPELPDPNRFNVLYGSTLGSSSITEQALPSQRVPGSNYFPPPLSMPAPPHNNISSNLPPAWDAPHHTSANAGGNPFPSHALPEGGQVQQSPQYEFQGDHPGSRQQEMFPKQEQGGSESQQYNWGGH